MNDTTSTGLTLLGVDETSYETQLTRKFLSRKRWEPPQPGKVACVIPGIIQKVHVRPGQQVRRGEPLVVLEAMKMQNDIVAPADGSVKQVLVVSGEQVARGQLLIELAEIPAPPLP